MMKNLLVQCFVLFLISSCVFENKNSTHNNKKLALEELSREFNKPSQKFYPETWFHLNGNNISKEGLTLDLEAIKEAGIQGIHLFNKSGSLYPNVKPIKTHRIVGVLDVIVGREKAPQLRVQSLSVPSRSG
jgi:hypothetical protein